MKTQVCTTLVGDSELLLPVAELAGIIEIRSTVTRRSSRLEDELVAAIKGRVTGEVASSLSLASRVSPLVSYLVVEFPIRWVMCRLVQCLGGEHAVVDVEDRVLAPSGARHCRGELAFAVDHLQVAIVEVWCRDQLHFLS